MRAWELPYYEKTVAVIVSKFPKLPKNTLIRNAIRNGLHPYLANEALSEDSDCEVESGLRVPKGATKIEMQCQS